MRLMAYFLPLIAVLWISGCGNGRQSTPQAQRAGAVVTISWPARSRLIPRAAESIQIQVSDRDAFSDVRIVDRPVNGETSTVVFDSVPVGELTITGIAYPQVGAAGTPQATGTTVVQTIGGEQARVTLTLASTIVQLEVSAVTATLQIGETLRLVATPRDRDGNMVLVAPDGIEWRSDKPDIAKVTNDGTVSALNPGDTRITASEPESGISASVAVAVTAPIDTGQIAFLSNRDGNDEIYVMSGDGSNVRRLTFTSAREDELTFSPDGRQIAFISRRDGGWEVYTMDDDGSNQRRVTNNTLDDWGPSFAPDGRIVYFETINGSDEILIANPDGSGVERLTFNSAFDVLPVITPDGRQIVFNSNRDGNYEIYIMNTDGSGQTRLTNNAANDWYHAVSPDGRLIAYTSGDHLAIMNIDGSNQRALTNPAGYEDARPTFSPDGKQLAFATNRDGQWEIYAMDLDGSNPRRLTNNAAKDWHPSWGPTP